MTISKVIIGFSTNRFSDPELIAKAVLIKNQLTGNVHFETPDPPLVALTLSITTFTDGCNAAADGGKEATVLKNVARKELENILRQLGEYVQHASFGNEARILSSGFDVAKKREPVGPLPQATGLVVDQGINSGEVILECDVIPKAAYYEFEYTALPAIPSSVWERVSSTKHQVNIQGLTKGVEYIFRVVGNNSDPSRNWSLPVTRLVI